MLRKDFEFILHVSSGFSLIAHACAILIFALKVPFATDYFYLSCSVVFIILPFISGIFANIYLDSYEDAFFNKMAFSFCYTAWILLLVFYILINILTKVCEFNIFISNKIKNKLKKNV